MVSAVNAVNGEEKVVQFKPVVLPQASYAKAEESPLDKKIDELRGLYAEQVNAGQWDDNTNDYGAAHWGIPLISLLTIRASLRKDGTSDRGEAKDIAKLILNRDDLVKESYYKGAAKIYLASIYYNEINDGQRLESTTGEIFTLCDEGRAIVEKPEKAIKVNKEDKLKMGVTIRKKKGTSATASGVEIDYYVLYLSDIIKLQARSIRKDQKEDQDASLIAGYEQVKKGIKISRPSVSGELMDVTLLGLDMLTQVADAQIAALAKDNRLADDNTQAEADLKEIDTEIQRARAVVDAKSGMPQIEKSIKDKELVTYYRNMGLALPTESFDYYSAKITLADLLIKRSILNGSEEEREKDRVEAIKIYGECAGKLMATGTYKSYISVWANLGLINAAIAHDKLKGLTLYSFDANGKATAITYKTKTEATAAALAYLVAVRGPENKNKPGEVLPPLVPAEKFLYCQIMLAEANLRTNGNSDKDFAIANGLCNSVISYALKFRNQESKWDMVSRAFAVKARALDFDPIANRGTAETPDIALSTLGDIANLEKTGEPLEESAPDIETKAEPAVKVKVKGKAKNEPAEKTRHYTEFNSQECYAAAFAAAAKLAEISGKKEDITYYADIYYMRSIFRDQNANIYNAMYMMDKVLTATPPAANKEIYTAIAAKARASYKEAYDACLHKRSLSRYWRGVVTNLIKINLNVMDAYELDITPTDKKTAEGNLAKFKSIAEDTGKAREDLAAAPTIAEVRKADPDEADYIEAIKAIKRIDILARAVYFVNNQMASTYSTAAKARIIKELYDMIDATLQKNKDIIEVQLTEGEKKPLYNNIVSVAMIYLGFVEDENLRTKTYIPLIRKYCFRALGIDIDEYKKAKLDPLAALKAKYDADATLMIPYSVGDALVAIGLSQNDKDLYGIANDYCFKRLLDRNNVTEAEEKEFNAQGTKKERVATIRRKMDIAARCLAQMANIVNWKYEPKDPEKLTEGDLAIYNGIIGQYEKAIRFGLGKRDLSLRVNLAEARFKVKAGVRAITDPQIVAKAESYVDISKELDEIIALADKNGDPLENLTLLRTPHSTFIKNKVAIMKAKMWKAVIIVSCGDLCKINTPGSKAALTANTANTDFDISKYDISTLKGIVEAQNALFKVAIDMYKGLSTAVTSIKTKYGVSERGMGDYGVNTVSLNTNNAISLSILCVIANDSSKEKDAKDRLKALLDNSSNMTALQVAEAQKAYGNLLVWRGLSRQDYYIDAVNYLNKVIRYYIDLRMESGANPDDESANFKCVPLPVWNTLVDALEMRMYDPKTLKDNKTTFEITGHDDKTLKRLNAILDNIINNADKKEDAWSNATLKKVAMILLLATTDLAKMVNCVDLIETVLTNSEMSGSVPVPTGLPANIPTGNMYEANALAANAKINYYINALLTSTDPAVKNNKYIISALVKLGVIQARLISSIGYLANKNKTGKVGEVETNKDFYMPLFQASVDNLGKIFNFLAALDRDPSSRFYQKLNEKVDPKGPMFSVTDWKANLKQGAVKTWKVNLK